MLVKYYYILLDFLTFAGVQHMYDHQSLKLITQKSIRLDLTFSHMQSMYINAKEYIIQKVIQTH